ncbi:MAG TPA: hypothetical protein PKA27_10900 [Fimbriimonadaceae bacterium]|nr:hypothetical protein [Fimbriimonadaceae bacterium]
MRMPKGDSSRPLWLLLMVAFAVVGCDPTTKVYIQNGSSSRVLHVRSHENMEFRSVEPGRKALLMSIVRSTRVHLEFRFSGDATHKRLFEPDQVKSVESAGKLVVHVYPDSPPKVVLSSN